MDRATASSNREPRRATLRQRVFEALRERINFPEEIGARLCGHDLSQDIFLLLERPGIGLHRSRLLIKARGCPADVAVNLELDRRFPILPLN